MWGRCVILYEMISIFKKAKDGIYSYRLLWIAVTSEPRADLVNTPALEPVCFGRKAFMVIFIWLLRLKGSFWNKFEK